MDAKNATRVIRDIRRIRDLDLTHDEQQWLLAVLSGTPAMTSALRLLERHRRDGVPAESLDQLIELYGPKDGAA